MCKISSWNREGGLVQARLQVNPTDALRQQRLKALRLLTSSSKELPTNISAAQMNSPSRYLYCRSVTLKLRQLLPHRLQQLSENKLEMVSAREGMKWDECLRWFQGGSASGPHLGNEDKTLGDNALVANHVSKRAKSSLQPSALPSVKCRWPELNSSCKKAASFSMCVAYRRHMAYQETPVLIILQPGCEQQLWFCRFVLVPAFQIEFCTCLAHFAHLQADPLDARATPTTRAGPDRVFEHSACMQVAHIVFHDCGLINGKGPSEIW